MPRPGARSAISAAAMNAVVAPTPATPRAAGGAAGDSASKEALSRLNRAVAELKQLAVEPLLQKAIDALRVEDAKAATDFALKALGQDERNGLGWYLLAIAREKLSDFPSSIQAYESALALLPNHSEIANDLGRLAYRLGMKEQAKKLFAHFLERHPDQHEAANNLACVIRDEGDYDAAIAILKPALLLKPDVPMLWNTMATVISEKGDIPTGQVFLEEALRLDPKFVKARYNRGNNALALGDAVSALRDCEDAMTGAMTEGERQMMILARSSINLALGRVAEGWEDYEARLHPQFGDVTHYLVDRPRWEPGCDLAGKSLLVIGEQGLGDEVLFANTLPDLIQALGPDGRLTIAVEKRMVSLFQRSFPMATVGAHATYLYEGKSVRVTPFMEDHAGIDYWTPMGSPLRQWRQTVESFPDRERFLTADPARVAHWRKVLAEAPAGKKVGLLWKSAITTGARFRYFSPIEQWAPVLATPGVTFVNLQYGDCAAEIAFAREQFGVDIWTPPGIDLKQDLDDVAALSCALDLVVGSCNASLNLAAGSGAPVWLISTPGSWPRLGTDRYPWYPQARVFMPAEYGAWDAVMADIAQALAVFAKGAEQAS